MRIQIVTGAPANINDAVISRRFGCHPKRLLTAVRRESPGRHDEDGEQR